MKRFVPVTPVYSYLRLVSFALLHVLLGFVCIICFMGLPLAYDLHRLPTGIGALLVAFTLWRWVTLLHAQQEYLRYQLRLRGVRR